MKQFAEGCVKFFDKVWVAVDGWITGGFKNSKWLQKRLFTNIITMVGFNPKT